MFVAVNQMYECYLPIAKILDIPVIATSTFRWMLNADSQVGNPRNPAATPFEFSFMPKKMIFLHRLENVFSQLAVALFYHFVEAPSLRVFYNEYFPNFHLDESKRISLLFSNSHLSLCTRPVTPNSIDVGGIHISPKANTLPKVNTRIVYDILFRSYEYNLSLMRTYLCFDRRISRNLSTKRRTV